MSAGVKKLFAEGSTTFLLLTSELGRGSTHGASHPLNAALGIVHTAVCPQSNKKGRTYVIGPARCLCTAVAYFPIFETGLPMPVT